jgi:hypothetical protein
MRRFRRPVMMRGCFTQSIRTRLVDEGPNPIVNASGRSLFKDFPVADTESASDCRKPRF